MEEPFILPSSCLIIMYLLPVVLNTSAPHVMLSNPTAIFQDEINVNCQQRCAQQMQWESTAQAASAAPQPRGAPSAAPHKPACASSGPSSF